MGAGERLAIYRDMYAARLLDVLAEEYPAVARALGEDGFEAAARAYLEAQPSTEPSVSRAGRGLPEFLASRPEAAALPWLADLARLERLRGLVFEAADAAPLSLARLREVPPERWPALPLRPVPALAVLDSAWPLHAVWAAVLAGEAPATAPARTRLRVWRQDYAVYHVPMAAAEAAGLAALAAGGPFAAVCAAVAEVAGPEGAAREAGGLLLRWIEDGLLADLAAPISAGPEAGATP
jgi:hypothetical protein